MLKEVRKEGREAGRKQQAHRVESRKKGCLYSQAGRQEGSEGSRKRMMGRERDGGRE